MKIQSVDIASPSSHHHDSNAPQSRVQEFGLGVGLLSIIALLVPAHHLWLVQFALTPLLLIVPGVILLRALRVGGDVMTAFPLYVPCASIVVLFASGLVVDLLNPQIGLLEPLRPVPLLAALEITCLALLALSMKAPRVGKISLNGLRQPVQYILPILLPAAMAAGALRLNSGHGNGVALVTLWISLFVLSASVAFAPKIKTGTLALIVYSISLGTMWSFSLRGDLLYGFDISQEFYTFHQTVLQNTWNVAHPHDAYGAMLSVTIFPAELHALIGIPDLYVLKALYPAIASLFPVGLFFLARRIVSSRWAFVAAALAFTQATFAQELPAIARQEIALVLFVSLVAAMFDVRLLRYQQYALIALFGAGLVVSHYSTTYTALTLIALAMVLQFVVSRVRDVPALSGAAMVAFLTTALGALLWYGPVTHSASNLTQFGQTVSARGFDLLPNSSGSGGPLSAYLQGNTDTSISATQYATLVHESYAKRRTYIRPFPAAYRSRYALKTSTPSVPPVSSPALYSLIRLSAITAQQVIYILASAGALVIVVRRRMQGRIRQIGLLGIATLVFLVIVRLSGTVATAYNAERAFLQALVFLSLCLCWAMEAISRHRKTMQPVVTAAAAILLTLMFADNSGLVASALGGDTAVNLSNRGEDFERFYVTTPEIISARWLASSVHPGQLVYADRYGQLPLVAESGMSRNLILDVTPETLNQQAWVYASRTNVIDGRARADFANHSVSYTFPSSFLRSRYDLVYTDGSSEVFYW